MRRRAMPSLALAAGLAAMGTAQGAPLYFQGFEADASGWQQDSGGDGNGGLDRIASGGGALGLAAFDGSYYGEVHNSTNAYQAGYGTGGSTLLNGNGITPPPYPNAAFSQSITVYINVNAPAPAAPSVPAFWIDMSPSSLVSDGVGCYPAACSDEHNFRLTYTGSSVSVTTDGSVSPALTINASGWYTFQDTYAKGATPVSLVNTDLNVFNSVGDLLSSTAALGNSDGSELQSSNLAGPGYIWLSVWQNGFSNNVLGIDDVRADAAAAPEPPSLAIFALALLGLTGSQLRRLRRRHGA